MNSIKGLWVSIAAVAAGAVSAGTWAAELPTRPATDSRILHLPFSALGVQGPIELRGAEGTADLSLGVRADEVITRATLHLTLTHSPAMLADLSHLRIRLNGETVAAIKLSKEEAGRAISRDIALDARYFTDYNHLRFDLLGHYTLECEDPQHSSLWASIGNRSELELEVRRLDLQSDLARLPAPFFDRRNTSHVVIPIVLAASVSRASIHAAGVVASWFGVQADYRGADFPVHLGTLPAGHAIVFATNAQQPAGLSLPQVNAPTLSLIDNPRDHSYKLLVFSGRDEAQLEQAVRGFVAGEPLLSGTTATISQVTLARRNLYDAPRWLPTDRAVRFEELVSDPHDLEVIGRLAAPLKLNLRLPPDLLTWNHPGIPLELHYRSGPLPNSGDSSLTVGINGQLVRAFALQGDSSTQSLSRVVVPAVLGTARQGNESVLIPAFRVGSNNTLDFRFVINPEHQGSCRSWPAETVRSAIDPDSTIDLRGFLHYAALPDLALFANAGYPFTRYADLSETAVVLPETITHESLEQLFFILGQFGRHTGIAATGYRLIDTAAARTARDIDLLVLGGPESNQLLADWQRGGNINIGTDDRHLRNLSAVTNLDADPLKSERPRNSNVDVHLTASGSLGALVGFESPLSAGRSVVALVGSNAAAVASVNDVLQDPAKSAAVQGSLAIVRAGQVQSYSGDPVYYVGTAPWWTKVWLRLSRHVFLLTLVAILLAVTVAVGVFGALQRRARRRLDGAAG